VAYSKCIVNDEVPTNQKLKKEVDNKINYLKTAKLYTLNEYIALFIDEIDKGKRLTDKKKVFAKGTVKKL